MAEDIEQKITTLEKKVHDLELVVASSPKEQKQARQKELKQVKDQLSALNKIANRGKIL